MPPNTRLRLHATPGSPRPGIVGRHGDAWKVHVAAAPERNAANRALVRLLADALGVSPDGVTLVSGRSARDKIVEVDGISPIETENRLASAQRKEPRA